MQAVTTEPNPVALPSADYDHVRRALAFMTGHWRDQPSLDEIAAHLGLSATHLNHVFRRWAGITPKAFLQALTLDHARALLRANASLLDTAIEVGLSGPGRLHDLFVTHEAMSPGEWKAKGAGLTLSYGFHPSPFGEAIVVTTPRGLAGLGFVDGEDRDVALADMTRRWPNASFHADQAATLLAAHHAFDPVTWQAGEPLRVVFIGSDFEVRVWETLLRIPMGAATTYSSIASHIGKPKAARAVGAAVGRNPVSIVVPCHRVIGASGALTGYAGGLVRKTALLRLEGALA